MDKKVLILALAIGLFPLTGCTGKRPTNLGLHDGKLQKCPDKPNCVVSQDADEAHKIEPITYTESRKEALRKLREVINSEDRVEIIENKDNYIRAEFKTAIFRFVDDVEFYFPDDPVIHVRSASRLGHSDLGLNRKRIERIRNRFNKL